MTYKAMSKRKGTKRQTMVKKRLHRKLKLEQHEPTKLEQHEPTKKSTYLYLGETQQFGETQPNDDTCLWPGET